MHALPSMLANAICTYTKQTRPKTKFTLVMYHTFIKLTPMQITQRRIVVLIHSIIWKIPTKKSALKAISEAKKYLRQNDCFITASTPSISYDAASLYLREVYKFLCKPINK